MKSDSQQPAQPRKRHIAERLKLNDASCSPGPELCDRLAARRPDPEALAIQAAWRYKPHQPVRLATPEEMERWF